VYSQRAMLLAFALLGCESPYPGWKTMPPGHHVRRSCDTRGDIAMHDRDGALRITSDPAALVGTTTEFTSAIPYRDGWLLSRVGGGRHGDFAYLVHADGSVEEPELRGDYTAFAQTSDGFYVLDQSCTRSMTTSLYRLSDIHAEPVQVGGPWESLCARALAVDDSGSIWLLGTVDGHRVELDDALLRVENGQPRIVHQVGSLYHSDDPFRQTYTQMVIVDGAIYLSNPLLPRPLIRVQDTEHGFVEQQVVPSKCLSVPPSPRGRKAAQALAETETRRRLVSVGVVEEYYEDGPIPLHILPYHAPLDTIVDLLIELLPADGSYELVLWSRNEPSLEPLARLPRGFSVADIVDDAATQELRRRFPNLDPNKR
jgi:hypothetical protein